MSLIRKTVNGKELLTFKSYNGTDNRAAVRRLLAHNDAVDHAEEGGGDDITVWFKEQTVNWDARDDYRISSVSFFPGDEVSNGSMAVSLVRCDDE